MELPLGGPSRYDGCGCLGCGYSAGSWCYPRPLAGALRVLPCDLPGLCASVYSGGCYGSDPVGAHRHEALTLVSAGRLPLQRLRFPRLFPARPQTFAGFAVLMAAPMWHSTGACVVFDTRLVNGRIFSLCVASRLTAVAMLRLARLPDISQVLFFVGEIPWPLGRDSAADLYDGDVIHVVPSAHAPMAVAFFDDLLLDPAYWLPEPPVMYVAVAADWLLCGLSGSLHFVQPGGNRALRSDVADALGVPAPLLALHRAADVGEDFVQDGVPVQAVFAVVAPPETTAPARSFVFCFLDLRSALRGFSQLRASGRWLAREAIVARVSGFCPPGYQPALSVAGRPPSILTPGFAVEEGLVIVVDFVPRNLAASDWVHVFAPPEYEDGSSPPRPYGTGEGHASPAHATRSAGSSLDLSGEAASGSGPSTVDALSTASRDVSRVVKWSQLSCRLCWGAHLGSTSILPPQLGHLARIDPGPHGPRPCSDPAPPALCLPSFAFLGFKVLWSSLGVLLVRR